MSDPNGVMVQYLAAAQAVVSAMENMRLLQARFAADGTLQTNYFALTPKPRPDLVSQDFTNAQTAVTQLLFTFDSGSPTQKSTLFKLL